MMTRIFKKFFFLNFVKNILRFFIFFKKTFGKLVNFGGQKLVDFPLHQRLIKSKTCAFWLHLNGHFDIVFKTPEGPNLHIWKTRYFRKITNFDTFYNFFFEFLNFINFFSPKIFFLKNLPKVGRNVKNQIFVNF